MSFDEDYLKKLVHNATESLAVEVKRWIDPSAPEGIAKIAKACIALRNNNGGFLLIGFDNDTGQPDVANTPSDVRTSFHPDVIQAIATKYASIPFEVEVRFIERDGQEYPVICIGEGVKTPVAAKASLTDSQGNVLIKDHAVYVRSLSSNNTVSTVEAKYKDWETLTTTCFDNREADIGSFVRRHLTSLKSIDLREVIAAITGALSEEPSCQELALQTINLGAERYRTKVKEKAVTLPEHGAWEIAFVICGDVPEHSANSDFLNLIASSNPHFTGWPLWMDSRQSRDTDMRPYVFASAWEALIISLDKEPSKEIDFWRIDPHGRFYHRRAIEDDTIGSQRAPAPLTTLDFTLPIWRVSEGLALGIRFARAMGCIPEDTTLTFCLRWTRLHQRRLSSWADAGSYRSPGGIAYQDEVISAIDVPLETSESALFQYVHEAIKPLYEVFDGFKLSVDTVEKIAAKALRRGQI